MANLFVQELIYRTCWKNHTISSLLDRFGSVANKVVERSNLIRGRAARPYHTGYTRYKAVLYAGGYDNSREIYENDEIRDILLKAPPLMQKRARAILIDYHLSVMDCSKKRAAEIDFIIQSFSDVLRKMDPNTCLDLDSAYRALHSAAMSPVEIYDVFRSIAINAKDDIWGRLLNVCRTANTVPLSSTQLYNILMTYSEAGLLRTTRDMHMLISLLSGLKDIPPAQLCYLLKKVAGQTEAPDILRYLEDAYNGACAVVIAPKDTMQLFVRIMNCGIPDVGTVFENIEGIFNAFNKMGIRGNQAVKLLDYYFKHKTPIEARINCEAVKEYFDGAYRSGLSVEDATSYYLLIIRKTRSYWTGFLLRSMPRVFAKAQVNPTLYNPADVLGILLSVAHRLNNWVDVAFPVLLGKSSYRLFSLIAGMLGYDSDDLVGKIMSYTFGSGRDGQNFEAEVKVVFEMLERGLDRQEIVGRYAKQLVPISLLMKAQSLIAFVPARSLVRTVASMRIGNFREFSGRWLSNASLAYLTDRVALGDSRGVKNAIRILLTYQITLNVEALRLLVEFPALHPEMERALAPDPAKKNQYPPDLQTEIKLDYIYYLTNGETKKAEALKILTEKNRGTNRMRSALKSLRAIDETFIKTEEFKRVKNLEDLSSRSRHRYRSALLNKRDMVVVMQADEGNREYVEKMLRQFGSTRELSGDMNVNTVVELLINVREKILNEHPMFAVENVYNKALSELRDDHGQYAVEAATFYEAWLGEMEMAADIHRQVIEIQQRSNRPLLVVLNERTVPVYFGRNHLPENYASRFGIVQKIDDEAILDQLGKRNLSEKELRDIGDGLFAAGQIAPLHGFKIGSSHDDINDNTLGIYIKNMSKMMEIFGGDIVFVDLSRRRVGGANAYLHAYLESNRLGNVMPLGKLREYKGRRFDGARGLHGLPELSFPNRQGTWYLCDPCKINEEEFDAIASRSRREAVANEIKSNELRSYFGGQKPFADDREHAFHQMRRVTNPTGAGVAPRFLKNKEAWSIPDLREGVIPICEYLARISGRAVPELINGSFDTLKPYYRFSLELMRVLDTLFAEEGLGPKNLQKRFYGSDCFGYQIRDLTEERKSSLISRLNYIFTIRKLSIRAVDSGKFIDIIRSDVNKGRAVAHFAEMIKIPEYKIVRIGDQPLGNDREMLARGRAYNVGVEPQGGQMPGLKTMSKKGPEGVLQVLDKVEQEGFEALAVDIDGTIESSKRVIEKLRQYLREGKKIAIVTGRGGSAQRKVVSRIKEGLEATHKTNLFVYLYNGAMLSP